MFGGWPGPLPNGTFAPTAVVEQPPEPPLTYTPPKTLAEAEAVVEAWVNHAPTGLQAWVYRLMHDGLDMRLDRARYLERKYRKELEDGKGK